MNSSTRPRVSWILWPIAAVSAVMLAFASDSRVSELAYVAGRAAAAVCLAVSLGSIAIVDELRRGRRE